MLKSITQTAKELGVSATQLRNWSDAQLIECVRKNTVRYFDESEFEKIEIIKKALSQPKATLEDARKALLGNQALQVIEEEEIRAATEEMMTAALDKALSENFVELFEGMAKSFREMQQKVQEIQAENVQMKQQLAKLDEVFSYEVQISAGIQQMKDELSSHEEQMKDLLSELNTHEREKSTLMEKFLHENQSVKRQLRLQQNEHIQERDKLLMQTLNELHELRAAVEQAAAAQQAAQQTAQQKRKKWFGLF